MSSLHLEPQGRWSVELDDIAMKKIAAWTNEFTVHPNGNVRAAQQAGAAPRKRQGEPGGLRAEGGRGDRFAAHHRPKRSVEAACTLEHDLAFGRREVQDRAGAQHDFAFATQADGRGDGGAADANTGREPHPRW